MSIANSQAQISIIYGQPFLATSNVLINYWNGMMKLSFQNLTIDFNIFNQ